MVQYNTKNLRDITASRDAIVDGQPQKAGPVITAANDVVARISNLNDAVQALASRQAGTSTPTALQGELWYDTANNLLKVDPDGANADDEIVSRLQAKNISLATGGTATLKLGGVINNSTTAVALAKENLDVSSQDNDIHGLFIGDSGSKLYILGDTATSVYQYSLSTAYDVTTGTYDNKSFNVSTEAGSAPTDIALKSDGTKMYIFTNSPPDSVYQYTLGTAWDVSTAVYDTKTFSFTSQETAIEGGFIKPDGTKMYALGTINDSVYQYTMSTAWDVSTASYDSKFVSVAARGTNQKGLCLSSDGTKMYVANATNNAIDQYDLSIAWDVSTAVYNSINKSTSNEVSSAVQGAQIKSDGTRLYICGFSNALYQYDLPVADDIAVALWDVGVYTLPANELDADGKILHVIASGTRSGSGAATTLVFRFGAATASHTLASNITDWRIEASIIRTGAATQKIVSACYPNRDDTASTDLLVSVAGTEDLTADIELGIGVSSINSADGISHEYLQVELLN